MSAAEWTPAFEGQRPPFDEGNEAVVTHGARSSRKVEELARKIDADLAHRAPWVLGYPEALGAYARAESVARLLYSDVAKNGAYDGCGNLRAMLLTRYNAAENAAAKHREALGLTPRSEAQVARDRADAAATAVSLADIAARGREAVQHHLTPSTTDSEEATR